MDKKKQGKLNAKDTNNLFDGGFKSQSFDGKKEKEKKKLDKEKQTKKFLDEE